MKKYFYTALLFTAGGCFTNSEEKPVSNQEPGTGATVKYSWTKLLDSAQWKKNYNFQMFSINDTIWVFHPDGNWYAADGKNWNKSALPNAIYNLAFLDYVYFNGAVWGLGHFEGNIEQFRFQPVIYKTTGFKKWDTVSVSSGLPERFFYHPFVFDNKIWIIGGEDRNTAYNDVWSSADGLNWQKETDEIVKGTAVFGYTAVVFDNKIWLLGCNRNGQFSNQVLYSSDGKNWLVNNAPWLPRGGIAATVYQNKIYITGGKYGGTPNHPNFRYDNDVWVLSKN